MSKDESPISLNEHLSALLDDESGAFEERRVLDELKSDTALSTKLANYALIGETMRAGETQQSAPVLGANLGANFLACIHEKIAEEETYEQIADADLADADDVADKVTHINSSQVTQPQEHASNNGSRAVSNTNSSEEKGFFSWLRPVGGFAVAASFGALAFMGLQNIGVLNTPNSQPSQPNIVDRSGPTAIVQATPQAKLETSATLSAIQPTAKNLSSQNSSDKLAVASTTANAAQQYVDADAKTRSMLKRYVDSHMQYATTSAFVPSVRVIAYTDNQ